MRFDQHRLYVTALSSGQYGALIAVSILCFVLINSLIIYIDKLNSMP